MITYFLAEIFAWLLNLLSWIFGSLLGWAFPAGVASAFDWLFYPLRYFGWVIDLPFLGGIIISLITFLIVWWTYQIIRFGWSASVGAAHGGSLEQPEI